MSILSELAGRFANMPPEDLARVFSLVHERLPQPRDGGREPADAPPATAPNLPSRTALSPLSAIDPARIASVLIAIHDTQSHIPRMPGASYDTLRRRLRSFESHLREQASIVDALMLKVAPVQGAPAAPTVGALQQTVVIQCPRAGHSAGRFRCLNRFAQVVEVVLEGGTVHCPAFGGRAIEGAIATAEPSRFSLAPGADRMVRLALDVSDADTCALDTLSAAFDVRMGGRLHARVWLEAELYDHG
jgi:hypothetical protein